MNAKHLACAVLVLVLASTYPAAARAGFDVGVTVGFAPPPLPVYVQPPCPSPGYVWAPGYWAYGDDDYYWVPGTWVLAPEFGLLWTPGYWSDVDDYFVWHAGYWAPHVGFYGGINYGFGYFGTGFVGGYWRDHDFFYNRAVTNITNVNITNVYNSRVYDNRIVNNSAAETRVSYNGGNGVHARPTRAELAASHEARRGLTASQSRQVESARTVRTLRASVNHGVPPVAATNRPGAFAGRGVVAARQNVSDSRPQSTVPFAASSCGHALSRSREDVRAHRSRTASIENASTDNLFSKLRVGAEGSGTGAHGAQLQPARCPFPVQGESAFEGGGTGTHAAHLQPTRWPFPVQGESGAQCPVLPRAGA